MSFDQQQNNQGNPEELDEVMSNSSDDRSSTTRSSSTSSSEEMSDQQRDLTDVEMEKLVQLQDLTGIDDLQICRALLGIELKQFLNLYFGNHVSLIFFFLESKNWDLEATAREHLNFPEPSSILQRSVPMPTAPEEAPNARHIMRRPPREGPQESRLVPRGHTVFSWAMYLFTLPFRLTYRTVFGAFDLVLSILGLSSGNGDGQHRAARVVQATSTRPEDDVAEFINFFSRKYGRDHLTTFHTGSYIKALEEAKRDLKFLLVYLHSPCHQDTEKFCSQTLASPALRDFLINMNVIVWACSVDTPEGYRVSQALRESSYPFLALIVLRQSKMMVVGRVEGFVAAEPLVERLQVVIRDNEAYIVAASAERAERNINAEIRQEQDAAFQETLRLDQERERLKREAEEAKKREEEEERAREQAEVDRKASIQRQKIQLASEVPEEPSVEVAEAVRIVIKLPEGQRLERRFLRSQSLKYLYYYVFSHPDSPDEFDITTNFPRKVLECKPMADGTDPLTFEEAGLGKSTMLFVNDLEA